jgi:hypothetical protein
MFGGQGKVNLEAGQGWLLKSWRSKREIMIRHKDDITCFDLHPRRFLSSMHTTLFGPRAIQTGLEQLSN